MQKKTLTHESLYTLFNHNVLIVWKPEYNLGIPIIDEQHRGIVTVINSLFYAIQNNHGESILKPVIEIVTEYTQAHFKIEEDFLQRYGYPQAEAHQRLHDELRSKLYSVGSKSVWNHNPNEFLVFLKDWWIDHICEKDRIFRDFLLIKKSDEKE